MPESPQVLEDVFLDVSLARDRSRDLVQGRRLDVSDSLARSEVDRSVEEGMNEDLGHLKKNDVEVSEEDEDGAGVAARGGTNGDPLLRIDDDHPRDEVLGLDGHVSGHDELAELDLLEEEADVFVVEGEAADEESEEDDPARPDVRGGSVIGDSLQQGREEDARQSQRARRTRGEM